MENKVFSVKSYSIRKKKYFDTVTKTVFLVFDNIYIVLNVIILVLIQRVLYIMPFILKKKKKIRPNK